MIFRYCLKYVLRLSYPTGLAVWGDFFAISANLFIYWFTSKAFTPNFLDRYNNVTYFDFLIVAELAILIPNSLVLNVPNKFKSLIHLENFDFWIYSPRAIKNVITLIGAESCKELIRIAVYLVLIFTFFQIIYSTDNLLKFVGLMFLWYPFFIGISMLLLSFFLYWGRGASAFYQVSILIIILSGAYFPISVLPAQIVPIASVLPTTVFVDQIRWAFGQLENAQGLTFIYPLVSGIVSLGIGFTSLKYVIKKLQMIGGCKLDRFL